MPHHRPGLDELAAIAALKSRHGYEMFGITPETPVELMANGDFENPPMEDVPGTLYLGCGRGKTCWANEHFLKNDKDSSCFKLVAERLGIASWPIVHEVTREDRHGADGVKNHIAQVIKNLYDMGWSAPQVYKWFKTAFIALTSKHAPKPFSLNCEAIAMSIEAKFNEQSARDWYAVVERSSNWDRAEYSKAMAIISKAMKEDIELPDSEKQFVMVETYLGKTVKAYIPSTVQTNARISSAARSLGCEIVLMQGLLDFDQVGIMLQQHHKTGLCFSYVLEELRKYELMHRGLLSEDKLGECFGEGTLEVCPSWHGHQGATGQRSCFAVYHRSHSRPLAYSPTAMPFDTIKDIFIDAIKVSPKGEAVADVNSFLNGGRLLQEVG